MDKLILSKYKAGKCSNEEIQEILNYFGENPNKFDEYFTEAEWINFYNDNINENFDPNTEKSFSKVVSMIEVDRKKERNTYVWISSIAASILLIFGFWFSQSFKKLNSEDLNLASNPSIYHQTKNESKSIFLPDGSKIVLFPHSSIRYDSISSISQKIILDGKAKFDVIHDSKREFKVFCNGIITTDLGTIFIIESSINSVRVELIEGSIAVEKENKLGKKTILMPGQFALFNIKSSDLIVHKNKKEKKEPIKKIVVTREKNAEDKSLIKVKNKYLNDVLDDLALKYDVRIDYPTEKIQFIRMNMAIDTSQKIETILKNIAVLNDLELKKESENKFLFKATSSFKNSSK